MSQKQFGPLARGLFIRGMLHSTLTVTLLLLLPLTLGSCKKNHLRANNPEARPWKNKSEQIHFMITMAAKITGENDSNHCINELHRRLKRNGDLSIHPERETTTTAMTLPMPMFLETSAKKTEMEKEILLVQEAADSESACANTLSSCGNCHLPQKNNCDYRIYTEVDGVRTSTVGRVTKVGSDSIELRNQFGDTTIVLNQEIVKSEWLNGADPLETWWNFKKFGKKGDLAKTMLAISTENDVACINCHKQHGDFTLTKEGEHFNETGKVIKKVPLSSFQNH